MHFAQWQQLQYDAKENEKVPCAPSVLGSTGWTVRVCSHDSLIAVASEKVALPLSEMPLNNGLTRFSHELLEKEDVVKRR